MKRLLTILTVCMCLFVGAHADKNVYAYLTIHEWEYGDTMPIPNKDNAVKAVGQLVLDVGKENSNGQTIYDRYMTMQFTDDGMAEVWACGQLIARAPVCKEGTYAGVEIKGEFEQTADVDTFATATIGPYGYGTFTSPYPIHIPKSSEYEFYLPTITSTKKSVSLIKNTKIVNNPYWVSSTNKLGIEYKYKVTPNVVLKPYTAILIKGEKNSTVKIPFWSPYRGVSQSETLTSELNGAAVRLITKYQEEYTGKKVLTFGREKGTKRFGFFHYTGEYLNPGKAFILK